MLSFSMKMETMRGESPYYCVLVVDCLTVLIKFLSLSQCVFAVSLGSNKFTGNAWLLEVSKTCEIGDKLSDAERLFTCQLFNMGGNTPQDGH